MVKYSKIQLGDIFARLTVLKREENSKHGEEKWFCQCVCGKTSIVQGGHLKNGHTRSCGCLSNRLDPGVSESHKVYNSYKNDAKRKDRMFSLTYEEFLEITARNCFYCGQEPSPFKNQKKSNGHYIGNGIDRINSTIGYVFDNCVPCCFPCNHAKGKKSLEEFRNWVKQISLYYKSNRW